MISLLSLVALVALLAWIARLRERPPRFRPRPRSDDIDYDELEAAEREVRDLDTFRRPDDEAPGDDWGPGTAGRPRPPEQL